MHLFSVCTQQVSFRSLLLPVFSNKRHIKSFFLFRKVAGRVSASDTKICAVNS